MAHLSVPRRGQRGPRQAVAGEDDRRVMDHSHIIAALDRLSAREPAEAGNVTGLVLGVGAHIDEVDALTLASVAEAIELVNADQLHAVFLGTTTCVLLGGCLALRCDRRQCVAIGAELQLMPCEHPAGRPILETDDIALQRHSLQDASANDAACATGAVDHNRRVGRRILQDVGDAERQFPAGHTASAGNAGAPIFVGRARVEDDQFVTTLDPRMKIVGVNLGDVMHHLDPLAKVLARNIDAPLGGQVKKRPTVHTTSQRRDIV